MGWEGGVRAPSDPMRELVGPVMDVYDARRSGVSVAHVMSRGFCDVARLPLGARVAFFLTNAPLCVAFARLLRAPHAGLTTTTAARAALCASTSAAALSSALFHWFVLFGVRSKSATSDAFTTTAVRLLQLDMLCAYACGALLCANYGVARTAVHFAVPLALLSLGNRAKWRGLGAQYALMHGLWHVSASIAICLISDA